MHVFAGFLHARANEVPNYDIDRHAYGVQIKEKVTQQIILLGARDLNLIS